MTRDQILQKVTATDLFRHIPVSECEALVDMGEVKTVKGNEYLILERQAGSTIFLLLNGSVEILITIPNATEMYPLTTLHSGDVMGELVLLGMAKRIASARAKGNVQALVWEKERLTSFFETSYKTGYIFMKNLATVLAQRLVFADKELGNMFYQTLHKF